MKRQGPIALDDGNETAFNGYNFYNPFTIERDFSYNQMKNELIE